MIQFSKGQPLAEQTALYLEAQLIRARKSFATELAIDYAERANMIDDFLNNGRTIVDNCSDWARQRKMYNLRHSLSTKCILLWSLSNNLITEQR